MLKYQECINKIIENIEGEIENDKNIDIQELIHHEVDRQCSYYEECKEIVLSYDNKDNLQHIIIDNLKPESINDLFEKLAFDILYYYSMQHFQSNI